MSLDYYVMYDVLLYLPPRYYTSFIQINHKCNDILSNHPNSPLLQLKSITSSSTFVTVNDPHVLVVSQLNFETFFDSFENVTSLSIIDDNSNNYYFLDWIKYQIFPNLRYICFPFHFLSKKFVGVLSDPALNILQITLLETNIQNTSPAHFDCLHLLLSTKVLLHIHYSSSISLYLQNLPCNIHVMVYPKTSILTIPVSNSQLDSRFNDKLDSKLDATNDDLFSVHKTMKQLGTSNIILSDKFLTNITYNDYDDEDDTFLYSLYNDYLPPIHADSLPPFTIVSLITHNPFITPIDTLLNLNIDISESYLKQMKFNFTQFTSITNLSLSALSDNRHIKLPEQLISLRLYHFVRYNSNITILNNGMYLFGVLDENIEFHNSLLSLEIHSVDIHHVKTINLTSLTKLLFKSVKIEELDLPLSLCELTLVNCTKLHSVNIYGKMKIIDKIDRCRRIAWNKKVLPK
ncbi:F-box domain-containing protein [Entamoeba marina]